MNRDRRFKEDDSQVIYGTRAVLEAIEAGRDIERVVIQRDLQSELTKELMQVAREHKIPIQKVPKEKFNSFRKKNHQGVVCYISPISFSSIENVIEGSFNKGKDPFILILDQITDVRNFGAIVRSAECAGVDGIVIPEKGSARINNDAMKTSAGALNLIPVCRSSNLNKTVEYLQTSGITITACTEKGDKSIYDVSYVGPVAIIMGSEDTGISNDLIRKSEHLAFIPMKGKIGSLNVSVATAVILFEANRQRDIT